VNSLQFIVASATVGNAVQMASKLIAREGFPVTSFLSLASSGFSTDKRKLLGQDLIIAAASTGSRKAALEPHSGSFFASQRKSIRRSWPRGSSAFGLTPAGDLSCTSILAFRFLRLLPTFTLPYS
jgi:ATP-dependent helicase YprA (DUF1998 family)